MFCAVYIFVTFLLLKTITSKPPTTDFAQYGRIPPSSDLPHFRRQFKYPNLVVSKALNNGERNVQKLVNLRPAKRPIHQKLYGKVASPPDEGPKLGSDDDPASLGNYSKNGKDKGLSVAPQDVNRVQELTRKRWPMAVIPYFVDTGIYDPTAVKRIVKAMNAIESASCVIFRELEMKPEDSPDRWLHFTNPRQERECVHKFSTYGAETVVVLGFDCLHLDEILHSLLHALGFRDEVTHPHRNQYIRILWNNIQPKYIGLFRIQYEDAASQLVEYDPMSIMHFHHSAFSENGAATIAALVPGLQINPSTTLSQLDILRLKLTFSHECKKRSISDLIIRCSSLVPEKIDLEESLDASHVGDQKSEEELNLEEEGQNYNDEKQNPDKIERQGKFAGNVQSTYKTGRESQNTWVSNLWGSYKDKNGYGRGSYWDLRN